MVRHVIVWTLKNSLSVEEKQEIKKSIKENLENLKNLISGIVEIKVHIDNVIESSNADLMLDSTFENIESLKAYTVNPLHVEIATTKVRPFVEIRSCLDFEI